MTRWVAPKGSEEAKGLHIREELRPSEPKNKIFFRHRQKKRAHVWDGHARSLSNRRLHQGRKNAEKMATAQLKRCPPTGKILRGMKTERHLDHAGGGKLSRRGVSAPRPSHGQRA